MGSEVVTFEQQMKVAVYNNIMTTTDFSDCDPTAQPSICRIVTSMGWLSHMRYIL